MKSTSLLSRLFPFGWGNVTKLALVYVFANFYPYLPVASLYLQDQGLDLVQINQYRVGSARFGRSGVYCRPGVTGLSLANVMMAFAAGGGWLKG